MSLPQGHLSEAWSRVTKNAIAETIIALTKMEEEFRSPVRCIATTRVRAVGYSVTRCIFLIGEVSPGTSTRTWVSHLRFLCLVFGLFVWAIAFSLSKLYFLIYITCTRIMMILKGETLIITKACDYI